MTNNRWVIAIAGVVIQIARLEIGRGNLRRGRQFVLQVTRPWVFLYAGA
jgi:hypothetical protein